MSASKVQQSAVALTVTGSNGSKPAGQSSEHAGRKRSSQDRGTRRSQITILSTSSRLT